MQTQKGMDDKLKKAVDQGVLARLPITFLPFVNQQIAQWEYLFPNERRSVERLVLWVAQLTPPESGALFGEVVQLENRMGVRNWQFSTSEQTILNSSQLARSPYFEDWRRAVQSVFDAVDRCAMQTDETRAKPAHRLILIDLPRSLPVDAKHVWRPWGEIGRPLQLDPGLESGASSFFDFLVAGSRGPDGKATQGLLDLAAGRPEATPSDTWSIEAGGSLLNTVLEQSVVGAPLPNATLLSYARLDLYRKNFSHEMNTMRKDLADADAVFDRLRKLTSAPGARRRCPQRP
jgi:hypothetical protein